MSIVLKWFGLLLLLWVFFGLSLGCDNSQQFDMTMKMLEDGNADGHIVVTTGGSPLQAGMKQVFFLGPENASLSFDGTIDFGKVSATDLLPDEPD